MVTYNRKVELVKNIRAIFSQTKLVDRYYIIDNHGNDGTEETLKKEGFLDNPLVEYIYLPENIGGAGGFYTGLKIAFEARYDLICLMDDDGRPADNYMMERLVTAAESFIVDNNRILFNPLVLGPDGERLSFGLKGKIKTRTMAKQFVNERGIIVGTINPFNGTLVSRELIEGIGFPNKDFFIKGDEQDYYYRALKSGAYVATVFGSNYYHPVLEKISGKFLGRNVISSTEAPWKEYYRARNFTYMFKRDGEPIKYVRQNIKQIVWALKYNPKKIKTIGMIIKGWNDGMKGNLGPTIRP